MAIHWLYDWVCLCICQLCGDDVMSEKRFNLTNPIHHNPIPNWVMIVHDDVKHKHMNTEEIVALLNQLSDENEKLKLKLKKYEDAEFERTQARGG